MSETPYKLGQWFWGRLPELPEYSVVARHSASKNIVPVFPTDCLLSHDTTDATGWWCIVSDTEPLPPEPELRLPEGWRVVYDHASITRIDFWVMRAEFRNDMRAVHAMRRSRADCIRVIQAAVNAMEGVK